MKTTIIIETNNRTNLNKILEGIRTLKGVKKVESIEVVSKEEISPPYPAMNQIELEERIQKSLNGATASPEKVANYFAKWKNAK